MPTTRPLAPLDRAIVALGLVLIGLIAIWFALRTPGVDAPRRPEPAGGYLVCSWNVENFYDDRDDPAFRDDEEDWFGRHPEVVAEKVRLLADALLLQNDGKGPDVLAMVEVESRRCVELLRDALNERLPLDFRYRTVIQRDNHTGRHNAPAILSRLEGDDSKTRTFGIRRILEAHLVADGGAPIAILASHWTSRLRGDTESKREAYADVLYARVVEIVADDPAADVLLCGDYNDEPDDISLRDHLNAVGMSEIAEVREAPKPFLLDLMSGRDPGRFGTYRIKSRWEILDHLVAAPGLLDPGGWLVLPETIRVENPTRLRAGRDGHPLRFGNPGNANPRGPSDHFAISVRLRAG